MTSAAPATESVTIIITDPTPRAFTGALIRRLSSGHYMVRSPDGEIAVSRRMVSAR